MPASEPSARLITPTDFAKLGKTSRQVSCPPDKSLTHRAIIFASMAKGHSEVLLPLLGADCLSTMKCFRQLGVEIDLSENNKTLVLKSPGWDSWKSPGAPLDFGNSGTTARLLIGVFAATPGLEVECFGDASLSQRPMGRVARSLLKAGAKITGPQAANLLPLKIEGQVLKPMHHVVDKASAQVKSGIILAGLHTKGKTSVELPVGGRDHTEKILTRLGAKISVEKTKTLETISVEGEFRPEPLKCTIPGDPSSAAFFAVLAALSPGLTLKIENVLDNDTRCGFLKVMKRMGANLTLTSSQASDEYLEPVNHVIIQGGVSLKSGKISPREVPSLVDEVPILAVLALFAQGTSHFNGLEELRVKESDRLQATAELLKAAGGKVQIEGDSLVISGGMKKAKAFKFNPKADHRLAMAASILAAFADGACQVEDPECVAVSFPNFYDLLSYCLT